LGGNVENLLRLQDERDTFVFIADWHMLTTHYDRTDELPGFTRDIALDLLAAGLDPAKVTFYRQSDFPEVAEMALLLGMVTPLGWLERVPSYKERPARHDRARGVQLRPARLPGPADRRHHDRSRQLVPVGEDQVAHLELSREIVRRFNRLYGEVLVEPQALLSEASLIPGSDGRKMSKSFDNAIGIRDEPDEIRAKVRTFVTDPQKVRMGDPGRPEICPVFALHKTYSPDIVDWTQEHCRIGDLGCVDCKTNLADHLIEYFRPFRERRGELAADPATWRRRSPRAPTRSRPIMQETLAAVRAAMHFA
jgi:tryptophanyl-tRNA synthetase